MEHRDAARSQASPSLVAGARRVGAEVPRAVVIVADVAIGALAQTTRAAVQAGAVGFQVSSAGGRALSRLPGAGPVAGVAYAAVRPVADEGRDAREAFPSYVGARLRAVTRVLTPLIVDALDVDGIVRRVDVDALVSRVDLDAAVSRIDLDAIVGRIDVDAIVGTVDLDVAVGRVDVDGLLGRMDVDGRV